VKLTKHQLFFTNSLAVSFGMVGYLDINPNSASLGKGELLDDVLKKIKKVGEKRN